MNNSTRLILGAGMVVLAAAFLIGQAITPYFHGRPLLLTPDNRQVKDYLDLYETRIAMAEKEHAQLESVLVPTRPGAAASSVFELSQKARLAQMNLDVLARGIEQTKVPGGLVSLDEALGDALAAELHFADQVLLFVGRGDESTRAEALQASQSAKTKLTGARTALTNTLR
ncbi:MAG: hypothetical protein HZB51_00950 [Chloroflexi bacterium]|nr:hypothetical protein [Chloroflexota bacterium]